MFNKFLDLSFYPPRRSGAMTDRLHDGIALVLFEKQHTLSLVCFHFHFYFFKMLTSHDHKFSSPRWSPPPTKLEHIYNPLRAAMGSYSCYFAFHSRSLSPLFVQVRARSSLAGFSVLWIIHGTSWVYL
jgi:hypothetical protein